ncbi:MAG: 3-dehydroquinate synthase [Nitrospirae bacterium]|nr:3-dehydroquinate synthase [Nitrospirota bacterium]
MKNIVLTGFMGTGKTTVGKLLADSLGMALVDIDGEIEKDAGMTINDIFSKYGESGFREMETGLAKKFSSSRGMVISTGGGIVLRDENMAYLGNNGIIVCLMATPETILARLEGKGDRPLLKVPDPMAKIKELLEFRRTFYEKADLLVDTDGREPREVAKEIMQAIKQRIVADMVNVSLGERSYSIYIGGGILSAVGDRLRDLRFADKVAVVSNPTVFALYGERLMGALRESGFQVSRVLLPDGEEYKDQQWSGYLLTELLKMGLDRKSALVALGGGVIGDITGFAASVYMRGIAYTQVPTTLLSQVDSSVGGKTGVNHPLGKNMIGTFYQPALVLIDVDTLRTLPELEIRAGMAEVIKYGIIKDSEFFEYLESSSERILALDEEALISVIKRCCQIKAEVVSKDERESGLRAILNFGHTVGHALETATGYRRYLHGEAVAIGMYVASGLSIKHTGFDRTSLDRVKAILEKYRLPWELPPDVSLKLITEAMYHDKKTVSGTLKFVLAERIGSVKIVDISMGEVSADLYV